MRWPGTYIAVDWGTTNRRAYLIVDGACSRDHEDALGILSVAPGGFPIAVAELRAELGDLPMLLAGMVGSNRGWTEAPYVPCPAGIGDIASQLTWAEEGRSAIVPGLSLRGSGRADVMRGEEVQLFGAIAAGLIPPDAVVCHPGTHNKWVTVSGARIVEFRTVMTGELFNLLRDRSILSDLIEGKVVPGADFAAGVQRGFDGDGLTAELFAIRARALLGEPPTGDPASLASGVLIGADLRCGLSGDVAAPIFVLGRPDLTCLYAAALGGVGRSAHEVDGETAFLAGMRQIAERAQ